MITSSLATRAAFMWFKGPQAYSVDLEAWRHSGDLLAAGQNPYLMTRFFMWPPLWIQIVWVLRRISAPFGVSLLVTIPIFLVLVESILIVMLLRSLRDVGYRRRRALVLVGIALNPVCVILVCEHGNFDVLVALLVLLSVGSLLRFQRSAAADDWLLGCLWLGLAVALKSVPVLLAPLLLAGARPLTARLRWIGVILAAGPAAYGLSVLRVVGAARLREILSYRSIPNWFGATGWFHRIGRDSWIGPYSRTVTLLFLAALVAIALLAYRGRLATPRRLVGTAALLLLAVPVVGAGYGPQYFYWFWPLLLVAFALGSKSLRAVVVIAGAVAAATYLVEYGFATFLGAFLAMRFPGTRDLIFGGGAEMLRVFTLVRTPLWIAYLALLAALVREVADPVPEPGLSDLTVPART